MQFPIIMIIHHVHRLCAQTFAESPISDWPLVTRRLNRRVCVSDVFVCPFVLKSGIRCGSDCGRIFCRIIIKFSQDVLMLNRSAGFNIGGYRSRVM